MSIRKPVDTFNKVSVQCGTEKKLEETRPPSDQAYNWKKARETMAQ